MRNRWLARVIFPLLVFDHATAFPRSEDKACHREQSERQRRSAREDLETNGPIPYPAGYRVAFADKGETRSKTLRSQHLIDGQTARQLVRDTPHLVIIDLRLPEEYADEHLPGAINVPFIQPTLGGFIRDLAALDPSRPTLLYCDTGAETAKARLGFGVYGFLDRLFAIRGGIREWKAAGGETTGPKEGPRVTLDSLPEVPDAPAAPTPHATSADVVSPGPFPVIDVSYDFDSAKDFTFDGHGGVVAKKITVYLRKHADVLSTPFHDILDPRYPKERILRTTGHRTILLDSHFSDEGVRYRADGTLLRGQQSGRGDPNGLWALKDAAGPTRRKSDGSYLVSGHGVQGIFTDTFNNIWFAGNKQGMSNHATLNLVDADNRHHELLRDAPLDRPWGVVHDPDRNLLFYTEPFAGQIWCLPVDERGTILGDPRKVWQLSAGEPFGIALDEFGSLYVAADPDIYRLRLDGEGRPVDEPARLNKEPIARAHAIQFGNGPGLSETSLYVMSTPHYWHRVADPLTGYVTGSFRPDGSVTRQLNNVPGYASRLVRLDIGVKGARNALIKIPDPPPDFTSLAPDNRPPPPPAAAASQQP